MVVSWWWLQKDNKKIQNDDNKKIQNDNNKKIQNDKNKKIQNDNNKKIQDNSPTSHLALPPMSRGAPSSSQMAVGRGQPLIGTSILSVSPALTVMSCSLLKSMLGFSMGLGVCGVGWVCGVGGL